MRETCLFKPAVSSRCVGSGWRGCSRLAGFAQEYGIHFILGSVRGAPHWPKELKGRQIGGGIRADRALSCADRRHRHGLIWVRGRGIAFLLFPAGRRVASSDLSLAIYTLCRLRCAPAAFTLFSSRNSLGVEGRQFFRGSTKPVDAVLEGASRIYFTASQVFQPSRAA